MSMENESTFYRWETIGIAAIWTLLILMKPMVQGNGAFFPYVERHKVRLNIVLISTFHQNHDLHFNCRCGVNRGFLTLFIAAAPISPELALLLVVVCTFLAVFIGFFVAAASGYMAGLVGSSSSPISGIGIISVIVISLVLFSIGNASRFI